MFSVSVSHVDGLERVDWSERLELILKLWLERKGHGILTFLSETANFGVLHAWFERGWTPLQELLAPLQLKFYGKHWNPYSRLYERHRQQIHHGKDISAHEHPYR
jgi:hypothetical protein